MTKEQLSLFDTQPTSGQADEPNLDKKFQKIGLDSQIIMAPYLLKRHELNHLDGHIHFSIIYMYNHLKNNHQHFFGEFTENNDKVIVFIKKIRMNSAQYNRIIDFPISINGNIDSEQAIFNKLFDSKFVEQAFIPKHRLPLINTNKYEIGEVQDYNFYSDIEVDKSIFTNKFLTKYRVKMMLTNTEFSHGLLTADDFNDIKELYAKWGTTKEIYDKPLYNRYLTQFDTFVHQNNILQYGIKYRNKLIAFAVFVPTIPHFYYKVIQLGYRRDNVPFQTIELDKVISQIGQILHYLCFNELKHNSVRGFACAGAGTGSGEAGLVDHKAQLFPHNIKYYRVKKK
jgi:hypothetical protein